MKARQFSRRTLAGKDTIIRAVKRLMRDYNLSCSDVSRILGVHNSSVANWVSGRTAPTLTGKNGERYGYVKEVRQHFCEYRKAHTPPAYAVNESPSDDGPQDGTPPAQDPVAPAPGILLTIHGEVDGTRISYEKHITPAAAAHILSSMLV